VCFLCKIKFVLRTWSKTQRAMEKNRCVRYRETVESSPTNKNGNSLLCVLLAYSYINIIAKTLSMLTTAVREEEISTVYC